MAFADAASVRPGIRMLAALDIGGVFQLEIIQLGIEFIPAGREMVPSQFELNSNRTAIQTGKR